MRGIAGVIDRGRRATRRPGLDLDAPEETEYAFRVDGDLKAVADYVEDIPAVRCPRSGARSRPPKDLGDAQSVSRQYHLDWFDGTDAIDTWDLRAPRADGLRGSYSFSAYSLYSRGTRSSVPKKACFDMSGEKRLAGGVRPRPSATPRMWCGPAPQQTPR